MFSLCTNRFVVADMALRALVLLLFCCGSALALGGYRHRNRQNPSAYFSWGYGPSQRDYAEQNDRRTQEDLLEALLTGTEASPEEGPCFGKRCTINDKCCSGAVCVDMDGYAGTCLPMYGSRQGEPCTRDDDCSPGLFCSDSDDGGIIVRTCHTQRRILPRKQYNERCETSNECDMEKGLCCQLQRRHRQAPRKVCIYYKDPNNCLGNAEGPSKSHLIEGSKTAATNGHLG